MKISLHERTRKRKLRSLSALEEIPAAMPNLTRGMRHKETRALLVAGACLVWFGATAAKQVGFGMRGEEGREYIDRWLFQLGLLKENLI